ncbi:hypothetical protein UFOVP63_31 [uncultured Caudovirales phage]|uniref:Transglycosylase SLT domain-containing protein n=1 Tax=uncultured Caudovirales phage TaxID=2100421 RepID=A0A6J5KX57_9CAUD|nr:hypothetical protein UFOVP63_31 [uncultured Caudovirales phage]
MPIQLPDQGSVDLGRSRDASPDTYAPVRTNNAGQGMEQLAKALSGFAGTAQQAQDTETKQQVDQSALWVDKVRGSLGDAPAAGDINNLLSPLHPLAQARISQDLGYAIGVTARQKAIEEGIPDASSLSPTQAAAAYDKVRNKALASVAGHGNQFYSAGFMSAFNQGLDAQSQKDADARLEKGRVIQRQGVGNSVYDRSSAIIDGRQAIPAAVSSVAGGSQSINNAAQTLGVSARDLAAVISYETGGTFDPSKRGGMNKDGSGAGSFLGLIQFSPANQARYGVKPGMTFDEQMPAVVAYLKDNGVKPGMGLKDIYSTILTGAPGNYTMSDVNGSVNDHSVRIGNSHYGNADKFLNTQGSSSILPASTSADPNFDAPPGTSTTQTPGSNQSVDQRSDAALLSPKVLALRNMFFGVDSEYQKTGTLQKNEIRDAAANSWLRLSIDRRDPSILDAMPEEMMTPEIREKFSAAREHVANLTYQKYERDRTIDANKRADELRGFHQDIIGRLAKGEEIDPDKVSRRPDGSVNADAYEYAVKMQSVDRMNEGRSKVNSANIQDLLVQSGTTGKTNSFVSDDPILSEKVRSGGDPNMKDYRDAIMRRTDINSREKTDLIAKLPELMHGIAVMQHPEVVNGLNNLVQNRVNGLLAGPKGEIYRLNWPQLSADVASIYNDTVQRAITASIDDKKGVPTGSALRQIIYDAAKTAMDHVNFATSSSENVSKDFFAKKAAEAHNNVQTPMVQTPGKLVDVADPVTGKITKVWQAAETQATPAQATTMPAFDDMQTAANSSKAPATKAATSIVDQSPNKTMKDTIANIQDTSQSGDWFGAVKNAYDYLDEGSRQWFAQHQTAARNEVAFQEFIKSNPKINKELYDLHAKISYGSKSERAKATQAYQNRYEEIKSSWTPPETVNQSYRLPDIGLRMGEAGEPAVKIGK